MRQANEIRNTHDLTDNSESMEPGVSAFDALTSKSMPKNPASKTYASQSKGSNSHLSIGKQISMQGRENQATKVPFRAAVNQLRSKKELFFILAVRGKYIPNNHQFSSSLSQYIAQLFLPPEDKCSCEYLRDLLSGKKKAFPKNG